MQSQIKISETIQQLLRCPICHSKLKQAEQFYQCTNLECQTQFPVVNGIPILINEYSSVFSINNFVSKQEKSVVNPNKNKIKKFIRRLIPTFSINIRSGENYGQFGDLLLSQSKQPKILVIGGRIIGDGMECLAENSSLELVDSDVVVDARTKLVLDGHDIPFEDGAFDGVIIQAVLEHVVDPYRCVEEIHRVLSETGLVYAETPFMQQGHSGPYDFTRFTHLGHRRLFRRFEEIDSGAVCGPGMALASAYQYFLTSFLLQKPSKPWLELLPR